MREKEQTENLRGFEEARVRAMDAEEGTQLAVAEWLQSAGYQNPRSKVPDLELTFKAKHTNLQITLAGLTWVIGMGMQQRVSAKFPPPSEDCYLQVLASTGFIDFPQECGDGGDGWQEFCQQIISSNERIWQTPGADHEEEEGLVCIELGPLVVHAIAVWRREKTLGELLDALNSLSQAFHSLTNQKNKLEEHRRVVSVQLPSCGKNWVEVEVEAAASRCRAARHRSTKAPTSTAAVLRKCLKEHSLLFRNQDDDDDDESLAYHGILELQCSAPPGSAAPSSSATNIGCSSGSSQCGWRNILRMLRRMIRRKAIASTKRSKLLGYEADHHHSTSEELSRLFSSDKSMSASEEDVGRLPENFSGASLHLVLQRQSFGIGDDVLQWCNLEYIKDEQILVCDFEVSAFMGDELAAASIGISFNLPLQIGLTFDLNYDTSTLQVHAKQGSAKVEDNIVGNNRHTQLGPSRLVPHIVKRYFQEPAIRETIMKNARGCNLSASEDNVFLGFLQHMVVALASLNMLCPCCGSFHTYSSASKLVHPCETQLCRAQFATWVGGNQNLLELTMTPVDIADSWELELVRQELATKEAFPIESAQSLDRLQDEVSRRNLVAYETNYEHLVYAIAFTNACKSFKKYR